MDDPLVAIVRGFVVAAGLCVGSFLNVVIYRLPRECLSVAGGRSRCPGCATPIAWWDNIPVLSWLVLRGRARCCGQRIASRYPLVELITGLLWAGALWHLVPDAAILAPGAHVAAWLEFGVAALVVSVLVALSVIDLDFRILPNELTKSGIVLGPLLAGLAPGLQPTSWPFSFEGDMGVRMAAALAGALGAVVSAGSLWGIGWLGAKAFKKPAMGFGDVKMIGAMGGLLGVWALLALLVAAVAGSVIGGLVLLIKRSRYIPFGPFLAIGMVVVMIAGKDLWEAYLGLLRP